MKFRHISCLFAFALCCSCASPRTPVPGGEADFILTNGKIRTPDGWAEALAIADSEIIAVGRANAVARTSGQGTRVIQLDGKVVLPGFHDLHVHPLFGGMLYSGADHTQCKIVQGSTERKLIEALSECVGRVSGSEWVTGGQWDASALGQGPTRAMIDAVSPQTPVLINDTSGHSALANSRALQIAGIDGDTADPEGGIIERDATGVPTGILRESAIGLVRAHVPPPADHVIREALEWSLRTMTAYGITSFTEASTGFIAGPSREAQLYAALVDDGVLKQRTRLCINWAPDIWTPGNYGASVIEHREQYERERLTLDCVKLFLDGVPTDSHTAAMLEPYAGTVADRDDEASRHGLLLIDQQATNDAVTEFDNQGLTVKFHAAGDAAVRSALDAIAAARAANGMSGVSHNVGHCTFIAESDLPRAKLLEATFEMSPYLWSPSPINDDITAAIGPERIKRVWPFRDAIDAGALVVPGSDWAVVPSVNPWLAIEALVTREKPGGSTRSFGKGQAISVEEAIDLFTVNAAKHMGTEDRLGRILPGMLADLVVIDRDPFDVPATELHQTKVLMTIIDGELVFDGTAASAEAGRILDVDVFKGGFATVNSFIFSNGKSLVVMDVQRKTYEARKLVDAIKAKGLPVTHILITHGHTDHFTGMPLLRDEFPEAKIVVANKEIKRDIKAYAIYMNTGGDTDAEPALEPPLRPKSAENPDGFDYENYIDVLPANTLTMDGGGTLELTTDYKPAEADHIATVYSEDLNALFLSDFGYNQVHHWMGDDISWQDIANWREELVNIKTRYADRNPTVYPGHGDPGDMSLFDEMIQYIDDYTRIVSNATSREEAMQKMIALYPDHKEADFFLKYSVENHVK